MAKTKTHAEIMEAGYNEQEMLFEALSRIINALDTIPEERRCQMVYQQRLRLAAEGWEKITKLHQQLHEAAHEEDLDHSYFRDQKYITHESLYLQFNDEIMVRLSHLSLAAGSTATSTPPGASSTHVNCQALGAQPVRRRAKLPDIPLPNFDGKYTDWITFRDYFNSLVINDESLDDVQRLHYLRSSLSGEPATLLKNRKSNVCTFDRAWDILTTRYNSERLIVFSHLSLLFNLPSMQYESASQLRTLRDSMAEQVDALISLNRIPDINTEDPERLPGVEDILVFLAAQKFDPTTRRAWELQIGVSQGFPTYRTLDKFMLTRLRALEAIPETKVATRTNTKSNQKANSFTNVSTTQVVSEGHKSCPVCNGKFHPFYMCLQFKKLNPKQRYQIIKSLKHCINCFSSKHDVANCLSEKRCAKCKLNHHTLLHFDNVSSNAPALAPTVSTAVPTNAVTKPNSVPASVGPNREIDAANKTLACMGKTLLNHVTLATATVLVSSPSHRTARVRAFLDQGSTRTLVTADLAKELHLSSIAESASMIGIGNVVTCNAKASAIISVRDRWGRGPAFTTQALILPTITCDLPTIPADLSQWSHLTGLEMADDPSNDEPIRLLIGGALYAALIQDGLRKGTEYEPIAQRFAVGWVISGSAQMSSHSNLSIVSMFCHPCFDLGNSIKQFWELEEISSKVPLSPSEKKCEDYFESTHTRDSSGRYIVRLPFKEGPPIDIGYSRNRALRCLVSLRRRLSQNSDLAQQYNDFLQDYENQGHMLRVDPLLSAPNQVVYLPHHPVIKESSTTTKLRVVFNAASLTSNYTSLNDHLLVGPKLQNNLFDILLNWRTHRFVYTADISQMFRQIRVHTDDQDYQRIIWQSPSDEEPVEFRLATVTYGTASAPYLALRVLQQLAIDERESFPEASRILENRVYVDDCLFGAPDVKTAISLRLELTALLERGGFRPRKWAANDAQLLDDIDPRDHGLALEKPMSEGGSLKILGVSWIPLEDCFRFRVDPINPAGATKRKVLSSIFRLYDPMGWVAPTVIRAKILLQVLWTRALSWDDTLPTDLQIEWERYCEDLSVLSQIVIPRWIKLNANCTIHGYADASIRAYAAVIYLRSVDVEGNVSVSLLASKTRVAPLKSLTVPKLELCAALLLATLLRQVLNNPGYTQYTYTCWSDSTTTLYWLSQHAARWNTFVSNRVAQIQDLLPNVTWRYVPTDSNPADQASRGSYATELVNSNMWWQGPDWLSLAPEFWPHLEIDPTKSARMLYFYVYQRTLSWTSYFRESRVGLGLSAFLDTCSECYRGQRSYSTILKLSYTLQ